MLKRVMRLVRRKGWSDVNARVAILRGIANWLLPDYRLTWPQMGWWHDADFNAYLERFDERRGFNTHRRWTLWQLVRLVTAVEGDTAECGVFRGASSWLICAATEGNGRKHHLFDSFEGLSEPEAVDGGHWKAGALAAGEDLVRDNLRPFADRLTLHKGWIPDRFRDVEDGKFAFVHVDVDLRQPTVDSLEFFYPRLSPGAVFLCDDYGCTTCPGATEVIDQFLNDKPEKMVSLDAGGGFFIKGIPTAAAATAVA
jgi:O-methyltransferase